MVAFAYAWLSPLLIVFSILLAGIGIKCLHSWKMRRIMIKGEQVKQEAEPKETTKDSEIMSI